MDPPPNTSQPTAASATTNGTNNVPQHPAANQSLATLPSVAQPALDLSRKDEKGSRCAPCLNAKWYDCDHLSRAEDAYGKRPACSNCRFFGGPKVDCYKGGSLNDSLYHQALRKTDHSLAPPKVRQDNPKSVLQGWQGQRNPEGQLQLPPNLQGPDIINRLNLTKPIAQPKPKLSRPSSASRRASTIGPHTVNNSMTINNYYNYPPPNEGPVPSGVAQPSAPTAPHGARQQSQPNVGAPSHTSGPSTPHSSRPQASTPQASTSQGQSNPMRQPQLELPVRPDQTIMPEDYTTWKEPEEPKQSTLRPLPTISQKRSLSSLMDDEDEAGSGAKVPEAGSDGFQFKGRANQDRKPEIRATDQIFDAFSGTWKLKKKARVSKDDPASELSTTQGASENQSEGRTASLAEIKAAVGDSAQTKKGPSSLFTLPENLGTGPIDKEDLIDPSFGEYEDQERDEQEMPDRPEDDGDFDD